MADWRLRYLGLSRYAALEWSKDPSTKVGAVIYRPNGTPVSHGYNGFPQKIADTPERLNDRELKYQIILHAEMNAFIFAEGDIAGNYLCTWPFLPCPRCAVVFIQAGIVGVTAPILPGRLRERWEDSIRLSINLFIEAGVEVHTLDYPTE